MTTAWRYLLPTLAAAFAVTLNTSFAVVGGVQAAVAAPASVGAAPSDSDDAATATATDEAASDGKTIACKYQQPPAPPSEGDVITDMPPPARMPVTKTLPPAASAGPPPAASDVPPSGGHASKGCREEDTTWNGAGCEGAGCDPCSPADDCNACGGRKGRCCAGGKLDDPWTLPEPRFLKRRKIDIGGWAETGIYANAYGNPSNGPLGLRNLDGTFNLDQLWGYAERKADNGGCGLDWGFRTDYVFGTDAPDTQSFGDESFDYGWNSSRDYGSAIPQAYAEVAINRFTLKGGHFYTPIGYEVVPATGNFFYSHSYMFYFSEPFTHTGAIGTFKFNEVWSASAGWVTGWDGGFGNRNGAANFLGGVTYTPSEKVSLAWYLSAFEYGNGRVGPYDGEIYMNSLVFTYKLTEKWTYVLHHDFGTNFDRSVAPATAEWYGIAQYLMYKLNDRWSFGGRLEWFRDDDGVRVTSDGLGNNIGNPGNYWELTGGINYHPHANVLLRPEIRYDWYNGAITGGKPFDGGNATDQLSGGVDVIVTF